MEGTSSDAFYAPKNLKHMLEEFLLLLKKTTKDA